MYQPDANSSIDDLLRMQRQQMQVCGCNGAMTGGGAVPQTRAAAALPQDQQFASSVEVSAAVRQD